MRWTVFWVMVLVMALWSCNNKQSFESKAVLVKVDTVRSCSCREVLQFPAKVVPHLSVNMAFKVSGEVQQIFVSQGQSVRSGELLAEMDSRDYELQLQAARAEYMNVKQQAERVMALYTDSVATASDYDRAIYGLEQVTAKYQNAQDQLADTKLYAPFNGVVKSVLFDAPTVVAAGMPIMTLLSSGMPFIEIHVPSSLYLRLDQVAGYSAKFDFTETLVPLTFIAASPNANANQLYTVRLAMPDALAIRPAAGMSAMVDVLFDNPDCNAVTIPGSAIFCSADESFVWLYENGVVVPVRVKVSRLHSDGSATISQGLSAGQIIVTAGVNSLSDRKLVAPMPPKSETNVGELQ